MVPALLSSLEHSDFPKISQTNSSWPQRAPYLSIKDPRPSIRSSLSCFTVWLLLDTSNTCSSHILKDFVQKSGLRSFFLPMNQISSKKFTIRDSKEQNCNFCSWIHVFLPSHTSSSSFSGCPLLLKIPLGLGKFPM